MSEDTSEPPAPELPGYRVGRYLGGGASGMVWSVTRTSDQARLAAKVLLAPVEDASVEVACLQRLEHEHVLRLHDTVLEASGPVPRLALITDLAEGGSLGSAIVGRGHLTVGEVVTVLTPIARTLHDLHGMGLVHGDLSPANVLLDADGKPLLADFGLARLVADSDAQFWGTPGFIAPEVLAGARPTPAADVYAVGALGWTALVGEAPPPAVLRPHLPDVAPQAPSAVCDLILACLSHTAEARPDAGMLALAIWDSAAAEPAPRAGSEGARAPTDPWAGLTQRIRETARQPSVEPARVWHRLPLSRRLLVGAAGVGLGAGAVVIWPQGGPVDARANQAAAEAEPARVAATPSTAASRMPAVPPRSERTASRRAHSGHASSPATASTGSTSGTSTERAASKPRATPVLAHPGQVVQRLVDARARAWRDAGKGLDRALVVGSSGWQADRADLRRAARAGVDYAGLRFTARETSVRSRTSRSAVVATVIDRSGYRIVGTEGAGAPAHRGERVLLTLRHTESGWRIADWRRPSRDG